MIPSYYKSPNNDFTLIQGDCIETLSKFKFGFDMVFADPPYFLSGGGISYQSGQIVCVDKGDWDKPTTPEEMDAFNPSLTPIIVESCYYYTFSVLAMDSVSYKFLFF